MTGVGSPTVRFFFGRPERRRESPVGTRVTAAQRPATRPPVAPTPVRPTRLTAAELSGPDMVNLHTVASVHAMAAGDRVTRDGAARDGWSLVLEGALELVASIDGAAIPLGVVTKGECIGPDVLPPEHRLSRVVIAREPTTVMAVTASAFEILPPTTQRSVLRLAARTDVTAFTGLAMRHGDVALRQRQLVSHVKARSMATTRVLASPALRDAIAAIPALPVYATDLAFALLDERAHADEIVESIKHNPSLAGLVLKRVNSAYYGLDTKVSDYYRAVLLLGTSTVYQLVLESAVETAFPELAEARDIQVHAHVVSRLAYEVALASGQVNPLLASTVGLLHNIGDSVAVVVRQTKPDAAWLIDCVDASALGATVLAGWGLPERVHQVVEHQDDAGILGPAELDAHGAEIATLHVAHACHDVLFGSGTPGNLVAEYLESLGIRATLAAFCADTITPALMKQAERLPAAVRTRLREGGVRRPRRAEGGPQ